MKVSETIEILGAEVCLAAYRTHIETEEGANTVCQGFEARILDDVEASGYPLQSCPSFFTQGGRGLSHGGLTVWGDRMIDAGQWLFENSPAEDNDSARIKAFYAVHAALDDIDEQIKDLQERRRVIEIRNL